ncbi:tryptophan--tRNA ligase [Malassezia psittaci]|uniref:tryptophan--tRNA ligase n=1 Tax=Malassezia psittaci TaxID=1821823 RepID=A0AAF0JFD9_9BASI|nr:tryptophan--tRNA ligase [Malassezia psittaci]
MPQSPAKLREDRRCAMASLIAAGIDPNRCTLFHQDEVPGHTELMWILSCIAPFGRLERMTTWKSKLVTAEGKEAAHESHLQLGLFTYPVLQAADILLYHATHVPVGEDQTQHLELTRDFAHLFNQKYNTSYFVRPVCLLTPTKRILSLRDPSQKMSKSAPDANSRILLTDSPNVIQKKIRRAVTDSERCITYEPDRRPAISNLVAILAALNGATAGNGSASSSDLSDPGVMAQHLEQITGGSGSKLKEVLAESIIEALRPFQTEYTKLVDDPAYLEQIAALGRAKASQRAAQTLEEVRKIIGIAP